MKILLVTYSCTPNAGSEDGVGWNMVRTLSLHHEVVVVTRGSFKNAIEQEDLPGRGHNLRFVYVSNPVSKQSSINRRLYQCIYYIWQLRAALTVRKLTKAESFDIVQHLTWIRCWMPSAIMGAASGKLVWGPVGGIESIPANFLKGWEYGRVREHFKRILAALSKFDPFVKRLARKATLGLATTRESQNYMSEMGCPTTLLSECALSNEEVDRLSKRHDRLSKRRTSDRSCIRFISMGRLLGWKGFQYGIQAFHHANLPDSEYWIVGDGPAEKRMKQLVADLGADDRIRFLGRVDRPIALELLSKCHVLIHPSFRDAGGWVCLEAMAARMPVICLELGGPAVNVTSETGTIIPACSHTQVIQDIASAMTTYHSDHDLLDRQGEAGLRRIQAEFTWDRKYEALLQHYNALLGIPLHKNCTVPSAEVPMPLISLPESFSN